MRQHLLDLYEIQKLDLSIRDEDSQRQTIPKTLLEQQLAVTQVEQYIQVLKQEQSATEQELSGLQVSVDADRDKLRKWDQRLNELRNQREFQALQRETEGQRRQTRDNEEKIGTLYKLQDEQAAKMQELLEQHRLAAQNRDAEQGAVKTKLDALAKIVDTMQARRDALVPTVPKNLYRKYETIRPKRFGMGLALVTDGCCVGCNMRLPPQLYNILQRGSSIEQCPSCNRLIVWSQLLLQDVADDDANTKAAGSEQAVAAL